MTALSVTVHAELEAAIGAAGARLADLHVAEQAVAAHAAQKAAIRSGAILRIMAAPGPSGRPHSWSSAEALRDTDERYAQWKADELVLAQERGIRESALWAARLRAEYLSRTLPPTRREIGTGYGCIHGVPIDVECAQCDAGPAL